MTKKKIIKNPTSLFLSTLLYMYNMWEYQLIFSPIHALMCWLYLKKKIIICAGRCRFISHTEKCKSKQPRYLHYTRRYFSIQKVEKKSKRKIVNASNMIVKITFCFDSTSRTYTPTYINDVHTCIPYLLSTVTRWNTSYSHLHICTNMHYI